MKWLEYFRWADKLYLECLKWRGRWLEVTSQPLELPDDDCVARHIFKPSMIDENSSELIAANFFMFSSSNGGAESLVWRRYAPDSECVHSIGRITAANSCKAGRQKEYYGFRGAKIRELRDYESSRGCKFVIKHAPDEGLHHAHIMRKTPDGKKPPKPDRTEMRTALVKMFRDEKVFA